MTGPAFCDECGRPCALPADPDPAGPPAHRTPPACEEHGPRWRLVRNAPCAAAVVVRDGSVLLARRAREPFAGWWEVPGGFVEQGEHPEDAARREAREELGVDLTLTGLIGIYLYERGDDEPLLITVYEATTDDEPRPDADEVTEARWFPVGDAPRELAGDHRKRIDDWLAGRTVPLPAR